MKWKKWNKNYEHKKKRKKGEKHEKWIKWKTWKHGNKNKLKNGKKINNNNNNNNNKRKNRRKKAKTLSLLLPRNLPRSSSPLVESRPKYSNMEQCQENTGSHWFWRGVEGGPMGHWQAHS